MMRRSTKRGRVSNLGSRTWSRAAVLIVPGILSLFALAGVTARPMLGIAEATIALKAAENQLEELELERDRLDGFLAADGFERTGAAMQQLRAYLPEGNGQVRSYGLVRLAAERAGIELDQINVGAVEDCGLPAIRDRVAERVVRLGGESRLTELVRMVELLRQLGMPTAVRDITISRESPRDPRFHFVITLGLLHTAPIEAPEAEVDV